jgi:hypothetical protein
MQRCSRCHNLCEVLIKGFCLSCADALHIPRIRPVPRIEEPAPPQEKGFKLVRERKEE